MPALPYKGGRLSSTAAHQRGYCPSWQTRISHYCFQLTMLLQPRLPVAITTAGAPGYTPGVVNHAAVSALAGNLHKALFAASILISGNKPAWASLHPSYPGCTGTHHLCCFSLRSPCQGRLTVPRGEQLLRGKSFLLSIFIFKICFTFCLFITAYCTHVQKGLKNLKTPLSLCMGTNYAMRLI